MMRYNIIIANCDCLCGLAEDAGSLGFAFSYCCSVCTDHLRHLTERCRKFVPAHPKQRGGAVGETQIHGR